MHQLHFIHTIVTKSNALTILGMNLQYSVVANNTPVTVGICSMETREDSRVINQIVIRP